MKRIAKLVLLITLFSFKSYAQRETAPIEDQFEYDVTDPNLKDINHLLDKFVGEWEYSDASHYLKIKFYKIEDAYYSFPKGNWYFDELRSFMLYKELQGGTWVTVYNTYPASYSTADLQNSHFNDFTSIHGNEVYKENTNIIDLSYYEPAPPCSEVHRKSIKLIYSNLGGIESLQWSHDIFVGVNVIEPCSSNNNPVYNYKIPHTMTLHKI